MFKVACLQPWHCTASCREQGQQQLQQQVLQQGAGCLTGLPGPGLPWQERLLAGGLLWAGRLAGLWLGPAAWDLGGSWLRGRSPAASPAQRKAEWTLVWPETAGLNCVGHNCAASSKGLVSL